MWFKFMAISAGLIVSIATCTIGQQPDPAAANRELIGKGPNVTVQQSAIGTLDVGGPGAANTNVTGENLRGNLGASTPQRGSGGGLPFGAKAGMPNYTFEPPNLVPDLRSSSPGRKPTKQELSVAEDLILPRFRAHEGGRDQLADSHNTGDGWRYRYFNGRWWYWQPSETWAIWDGTQWRQRIVRQ